MYTKNVLLASLAASAVSARQLYPGHNHIKRDIAARQTSNPSAIASAGEACLTDLASAYASLPTPPPDLVSYEMTVSITDPCHYTLPASISSALESYDSEVDAWYSSHSAEIASALSECPTYSSFASQSDGAVGFSGTFSDACTTVTGKGAGGTTATPTDDTTKTTGTKTTGTGTAAAGSTTTSTKNAGPKETAAVTVAAMAMAGVLGVVAYL